MSISTVDVIMKRIRSAEPDSPLAIFDKGNKNLDVIFATTIRGQIRVKRDKSLIGIFTNLMWRDEVHMALNNALRK